MISEMMKSVIPIAKRCLETKLQTESGWKGRAFPHWEAAEPRRL